MNSDSKSEKSESRTEPFQVELVERPGNPLVVKAQITLEQLAGNGKLTPLQSYRFCLYCVQGMLEDTLWSYRATWFRLPLWPYYAFRRWQIRRRFKKICAIMKSDYERDHGPLGKDPT